MTSDTGDTRKAHGDGNNNTSQQKPLHKFISPAELKMKVLKKLVSTDGNQENNGIKKFQRQNSDRTLKASIVFPNGDIGTLISYEKTDSTKPVGSEIEDQLPKSDVELNSNTKQKERPLRLPPIMLPRIYATKPLPVLPRDFTLPTEAPTSITDDDWEDLQQCRYLRLYSPRKQRAHSAIA